MLSAARLPDVRLAVITTVAGRTDLSPELREALAGHWQVSDALDPQQIADAVRGLSGQVGRVERLIGALEQLQVPLAQARDALGIEGMSADVATNVRDKSQMKSVLAAAGVPCARHQLVHRTEEALAFRDLVGYPMVAKPPDGAGAKATFRLDHDADFDSWLAAAQNDPGEVWLLEEFLTGREHTFDSVTLGGETIWASISDYRPPPLEVLRTPWVQWTVLLPRDVSGSGVRRDPAPSARPRCGPWGSGTRSPTWSGSSVPTARWRSRRSGARPPGAQLASMIGFSHDIDFYATWAELVITGTLHPAASGGTPPAPPTCAGWAAARSVRCTASTSCRPRSGTWWSTRGCRSPARRRTPRTRARASSPCDTRTPPWSRTRSPGSSPRRGSS